MRLSSRTSSISLSGTIFLFGLWASKANAIFLDGDGHYGLRGQTQTNPAFSARRGIHQGIAHSFRLLGEARANDKLSMNLDFRLLENQDEAYLGDDVQPEECTEISYDKDTDREQNSHRGSSRNCRGNHQDTGQPGYSPYVPRITEAYVRYGFDYCLLEAGRRGRDWGMGVFLDSGRDPFEASRSIYDGVTCAINIQKAQALGFSVGFDKLSETGSSIDNGIPKDNDATGYGPSKASDDLDQFFFTIEYDDRKANSGSSFTRQIGIYFANIFGTERLGLGEDEEKVKTDIKFADLYTAFLFPSFVLRNEVLFRLGKSADPSWARYGGLSNEVGGSPVRNSLDSIAVAGDLDFILSRSGSYVGPKEFNEGVASSHHLFIEYAYAPGDRDGYFPEYDSIEDPVSKTIDRKKNRNTKTTAMAFHRNYKPALIFFNGRQEQDDLRVDGIFDPKRVMNVALLTNGYKYESTNNGNFTFKFIYARLNQSIPDSVRKAQFAEEKKQEDSETYKAPARPIGFSSRELGYEVDFLYNKAIGRDLDLGIDAGIAIPNGAWRTSKDDPPQFGYLLQATAAFKF